MSNNVAIAQTILNGTALLESLVSVLEQENDALKSNNSTQLESVVQTKVELLQAIEANAMERSECLSSLGHTPDDSGINTWLQQLNEKGRSEQKINWLTLKNTLESCKNANAVNGKIVHRSQRQVEQLLGIMRGQQHNQKIYDQSGGQSAVLSNRSIAQA